MRKISFRSLSIIWKLSKEKKQSENLFKLLITQDQKSTRLIFYSLKNLKNHL